MQGYFSKGKSGRSIEMAAEFSTGRRAWVIRFPSPSLPPAMGGRGAVESQVQKKIPLWERSVPEAVE